MCDFWMVVCGVLAVFWKCSEDMFQTGMVSGESTQLKQATVTHLFIPLLLSSEFELLTILGPDGQKESRAEVRIRQGRSSAGDAISSSQPPGVHTAQAQTQTQHSAGGRGGGRVGGGVFLAE